MNSVYDAQYRAVFVRPVSEVRVVRGVATIRAATLVPEERDWIAARTAETEPYAPLGDRGLLSRFLRLARQPDAPSIQAWVSSRGWLGNPQLFRPSGTDELITGEPLDWWQFQLRAIHQVDQLWRAVMLSSDQSHRLSSGALDKTAAVALLRHVIRWTDDGQAVYWQGDPDERETAPFDEVGPFELIASLTPSVRPELLRQFRRGDPIEPARYMVHSTVNRALQGQLSAAVTFVAGRPDMTRLKTLPNTLLGVIYLKFLDGLLEGRPTRQCENPTCPNGHEFPQTRRDQRFCCDRCRNHAFYLAQARRTRNEI